MFCVQNEMSLEFTLKKKMAMACELLVSQPELETAPPHWKHEINHWTARKFPGFSFIQVL